MSEMTLLDKAARWFGLRCLTGWCPSELYRPPHDPGQLWVRCVDCGEVREPMNKRAEAAAKAPACGWPLCDCDPKDRMCDLTPPPSCPSYRLAQRGE